MDANGFPSREYSLKKVLESPMPSFPSSVSPTPSWMTPRGSDYPRLYIIVKHLLLAMLFLMMIWTMLKIPLAEQYLMEKMPKDMPDSQVSFIRTIVTIARVLVVILALFGIFGVIRESFSLSLVFSVFMFMRLVATLYVPYFNNGHVSVALISVVTLMSFIFLSLVRRRDRFDGKDTDSIDI